MDSYFRGSDVILTFYETINIINYKDIKIKKGGRTPSETIGVIVSILPLADFVKNVGKSRVKVDVLVPPGASPHTYEPTPSQLKK